MYLKRLVLKNIGRHALLDLPFKQSLVGIFGPNGSGKSTILDSAFACLTNNWGRFAGVKEDNIRDTAGEDEESSVRLVGEHNNVEFEVYRALRKKEKGRQANELRVDGKVFTKDAEIKEELEKRLGVNTRLLSSYVMIAQREMFSFLAQTPGERAAAYQTLCGTMRAREIVDAVEKLLVQDASLTVTVDDNSDELNQRIGRRIEELTVALRTLSAAKARCLTDDGFKRATAVVQKKQEHDRIAATLPRLQAAVEQSLVAYDTSCIDYTSAKVKLTTTTEVTEKTTVAADKAKAVLSRLEQYQRIMIRRNAVATRISAGRTQVAMLEGRKVKPHPKESEAAEIDARRAQSIAVLGYSNNILRTFEKKGIVECPTCGTPVTKIDAHLARLRGDVPGLEKEIADCSKVLGEILDAKNAVATWRSSMEKAKESLAAAETELSNLDAGEPPIGDEKALQAAVAAHDQAVRNREDAQRLSNAAFALTGSNSARSDMSRKQLEEAEATMVSVVVSDSLLERARQALAQHDAARVESAAAAQTVKMHEEAIIQDQTDLEALRVRLDRSRRGRLFADRLKLIGGVMHRQALPQVVAQLNLQDTEEGLNRNLEMFGSPFWAEASNDLSFVVHFPGEPPRPAERLSIGQRGVLAVAFRRALSALFDSDLGFASYDEPASDMDTENRRFLITALSRYATEIRGKQQLLVISHDPEMRAACDQVIEIGG